MRDPRICVIGAGSLSSRKIYPYLGLAEARLVGACDLDAEKVERITRRFGGTVYTDYRKMLNAEKPDGVIVCIGPAHHAKFAIELMKMGYPVYTEKPPASSAAEALEAARVARQTGKLCMTGFKKRYATAYEHTKAWLDKFPETDRLLISVDYCSGSFEHRKDLGSRPFLHDFTIHLIDVVSYLFGDVRQVYAMIRGDRAYAVNMTFTCGAVGTMSLTDGRSFNIPTEEVEITLTGGNFMTISNSSRYRITEGQKPSAWREPPLFTSQGDSGNETGHGTELKAFVQCLKDGSTPRSEIYEGYKSMLLYEAIFKSADTGEIVTLNYEAI